MSEYKSYSVSYCLFTDAACPVDRPSQRESWEGALRPCDPPCETAPGYSTWVPEGSLAGFIFFLNFRPIFSQSWAQERAQRPRLEKCCINQRQLAREIDSKADWVPEGSLAGFLGLAGHGGPGRPSKMWGAWPPNMFEGLTGPPGPARPQKRTQAKSGQTALRYPALDLRFGT